MIVRLEIAHEAHVALVAPRLRPADCLEVLASDGFSPEEGLRISLERSVMARTMFFDEEPVCMFGILERETHAVPWLLTTDVVCRYPLTFWKASKAIFRELREAWPVMLQAVDARYDGALSWARRLGFYVGDPEPFGPDGLPFRIITLGVR